MLGAFLRMKAGQKKEIEKDYELIFDLFPILRERGKQKAGTLSGGEQQMLSIGRAMMAKPKLLLLDEPSMGLAPLTKKTIFTTLEELRIRNLTLLLVEQDVEAALSIADRGYVFQNGEIVLEETSEDLKKNAQIKEIYFGGRSNADK
jgi:branched-chain amino acid transport system ATP-binding protein